MGWSRGAAEREQRVAVVRDAWVSAYGHIFTRAEIDGIFDGAFEAEGSWVPAREAPAGTLVARSGGRLLGLADLGLLRDGQGELAALYVRPEHQGKGIGTALWERSITELQSRGCSRMDIWTLERADAKRFYEARGAIARGAGDFVVGGHREVAIGYVLDISLARGAGRGPSTPTR